MTFQLKGWDYTESVTNLRDPDDLPLHYTQVMTVGARSIRETPKRHPDDRPRRRLDLDLSRPRHAGRRASTPSRSTRRDQRRQAAISASSRPDACSYLAADGRVFLNRNKELYDLILLDAYHGGYVPFHLLTKEFYTLVKQRLTPGGAVAFNVHDGTKLYLSTVKTLSEVFPARRSLSDRRGRGDHGRDRASRARPR